MGRRKIEIKAIKDDRNRSVTFLKRKGGLFKKAHELSVLCQVEVAVIIFGHNKKLYEFSSHDISETVGKFQYVRAHYGGAHEHKGPDDFLGKKEAGSDDEDEEPASPRPDSNSPPQHAMMAHHLQNQPAFQHLGTPHASPPMPNGAFHPRGPSPQPQNISRPGSRAHMRHPSQGLIPPHMQVSQAQQQQTQNYAYMPNPPIYNPQHASVMAPQPGQQATPQIRFSGPPPPQHPSQVAPMHPQQQPQMQQVYQQDQQRRQSMPPAFPQQPDQKPPAPSPQPHQQQFGSPPMPQPKPLSTPAKTHSIFTPIDDSRSLLAQHWGPSTTAEASKPDMASKAETGPRAQSIDVGSINRRQANGVQQSATMQAPAAAATTQPPQPQRTASTPVLPSAPPQPPSRTNSLQTNRPRLRVEIPSEHSDDDTSKQTAATSPNPTGTALTPSREHGHNGVVLPPPSPSASTLLSAGATGPPNPFARPPPPSVNGFPNGSRSDIETPISALPSRFMDQQLLSSPGGFYNWDTFNRDNMLPSPLQFQTPVVTNGPSLGDEIEKKRKISDGSEGGLEKRVKT